MLDLIFHAFYTSTFWMFLCEQNHVIGRLLHHQLLLVCEHLHFLVDTAYPHLLSLLERIQVIVDNIYHHLAIFRKFHLSIKHILGEPFIYYNGILVIIFGTVVLLVLFSRALVVVAKNIGIAMFKFKSADSELLKQIETSERDAIVLQSAWRRKQAMFKFKSRQIKARFDRDLNQNLEGRGGAWLLIERLTTMTRVPPRKNTIPTRVQLKQVLLSRMHWSQTIGSPGKHGEHGDWQPEKMCSHSQYVIKLGPMQQKGKLRCSSINELQGGGECRLLL
jgi:hypothetical protein